MKKSSISKLIASVFLTSSITALSTIFVDDKKYPLTKIVRNIAIVGIFITSNAAYILTMSDKKDSDDEEQLDYEDADSIMDFDDDDDDLDD